MNDNVKTWKEVRLGDPAYVYGYYEGAVLDKGTFRELKARGWQTPFDIEEASTMLDVDARNYVAVSQNPHDTIEGYTSGIFLYNTPDPVCACVYNHRKKYRL